MCIAILNKSEILSKKTLLNCWESNPDGGGLLYTHGGKLVLFKELTSFKKFNNEYQRVRKTNTGDIILHFRIGTSGGFNLTNCHPFKVNENLAFVHNGMINIDVSEHPGLNDTNVFNNLVLKKLPANFLERNELIYLLEQTITGSKMIFMDNYGNSTILNEGAGHWVGSTWYSNHGYKDPYMHDWKGWKDTEAQKYKADWEGETVCNMEEFCDNCGMNGEELYSHSGGFVCFDCATDIDEEEAEEREEEYTDTRQYAPIFD